LSGLPLALPLLSQRTLASGEVQGPDPLVRRAYFPRRASRTAGRPGLQWRRADTPGGVAGGHGRSQVDGLQDRLAHGWTLPCPTTKPIALHRLGGSGYQGMAPGLPGDHQRAWLWRDGLAKPGAVARSRGNPAGKDDDLSRFQRWRRPIRPGGSACSPWRPRPRPSTLSHRFDSGPVALDDQEFFPPAAPVLRVD
jgi:hypothetical protein